MPRIFVALPIDVKVRKAITEVIPTGRGAVRWVKEQQYHITLKFLGDITEEQLQQTCAAIGQVGREWATPLQLTAQGVGAFPSLQSARVVWVGLTGNTEPLLRLQREVELALASLGFALERRPFTPHVTIGRLRMPGPMPEALQVHRDTPFGTWTVPNIQVIESILRPAGPIYIVRKEVALPVPSAESE